MSRFLRILATVAFTPSATLAVDGALDPAFANGDGAFFPSFAYIGNTVVDDSARAIVIGADQRITVVGDFLQDAAGADRDCGLLRTLPDASGYDSSFLPPHGYGFYSFNRGGPNTDECRGLALDATGGGYFVGSATLDHSGRHTGLIVRFGTNGLPDPGFSGDGQFESHLDLAQALAAEDTEFRQVLIDAEGRILVSGDVQVLTGEGLVSTAIVLRLRADGTPDNDFFAGAPLTLFQNTADGSLLSLAGSAEDADGGYWFAGFHQPGSAPAQGRLFRITAEGAFDPGVGGADGLPIPSCRLVQSLAIDAAGRVLLGCVPASTTLLPGVLRLANGASGWAPDPDFGDNGYAELRVSADDQPGLWPKVSRVAAIRAVDGDRLLVAGSYDPGRLLYNPSDGFSARLLGNGQKDVTFGSGGTVRHRFGDIVDRHDDRVTAMAIDASGRPVIVGGRVSTDTGSSSYVVARLQHAPDELFVDGFEAR